jgi:transcription-repair coupling factor (superfamily II helicase)
MLKRAVADMSDKPPVEELQIARLDIDVDAFIPGDYIPLEAARIDVHHRIAAARDEQGLAEIRAELTDRFGPVPEVVYNLLDMQEIRLRAGVLGAASIKYRGGRLELADLKLDAGQRAALEQEGIKFVYHPLRRTLVVWLDADADLTVVKKSLSAIIDSLLTRATPL